MKAPRTTIQRKLVTAIMVTSASVLLLLGAVFVAHEIVSFRRFLVRALVTRADILAANSTAALAFRNPDDAAQVLGALKADPHMVAAALYDHRGRLFATYPATASPGGVPDVPGPRGHRFQRSHLVVFEPVVEHGRPLGTIYLRSDLRALDERLRVDALVVLLAVVGSIGVALALSTWLQRRIARPVLALAEVARSVSEHKDYSVRARAVSDDEIGVLGEAFDEMLSEIQQRDTEIRQLNVDLERRVIARTAELEASNKELEAFSYSVSHDLRAPLRAIDGFSKALLDDPGTQLSDAGKRHMERVRGAARSMAELIDDILNLARLSRAETHRERVDLSALGKEIAASLSQSQPERRVSFVIADGLAAEGDSQLLRVAFDNLLRNAWKFTSKHATARIEVGRCRQDGISAYFIRDDGAGFDMEHAKLLFTPFQRLHRQNDFEGTGVGLATVQRIIHRHGGRLWAEGAVERGATFYFTLWEGGTHG